MTQEYKNIKRDNDKQSWTVTLEQDGEDLILPLSDEMLAGTGWKIGDDLLWELAPGRAWTIRKKP
jgi:hypothetical protein